MFNDKVEFIIETVKKAGAILRKYVKKEMAINLKNEDISDLVTSCDVEIEKFIINKIREKYTDHGFLTEENTVDFEDKNDLWIIDPIDGTTNFIALKSNFSISVAYMYNKKLIFGVVYDVMADDVYVGIKGQGAFLNNVPILKNKAVKISESILDVSLKSVYKLRKNENLDLEDLTNKVRGHRSLSCASLIICNIALGKINIYMSSHLKMWDYAAAGIILEETGGYWNLPFDDKRNIDGKTVIFIGASNKGLYEEVINTMKINHHSECDSTHRSEVDI